MSLQEKRQLNGSLREAYKRNDLQSVERIVQNFPDSKYAHNNRIYQAIYYADEKEVESLLEDAKSDVNWRNEVILAGWSLLHKAAASDKIRILDLLLKSGANCNVQDPKGRTPIHIAASCNSVDVLSELISHGAALDTRDKAGNTALDLAKREKSHDCITLLEEAMTKPQENTKLEVQKHLHEPDDMKSEIIHHEEANTNKQDKTIPDDKSTVTKKQEVSLPDAPITPEVEASLIEAIKEGSGDINLALVLLHGAPAVGKSSLDRLLQGLPPLSKSQQHSTEIFQNPVRLINTNQLTLTGKHALERVDERKVMRMIAEQITRQKKKSTSEITPLTEITKMRSPLPVASSKTSSSGKVSTSQTDKVVVSDVVKGIAAELSKVNTYPSDLFSHRLFHIVDSGGQPQFTDVLPLMFPKVSLHFVVIRLDEKLDDKPKIRYLVAGEDKYMLPENLALSHLQMIERTCELAQAAATKNQKDKPPRVVVVGTRFDCVCPEESLLQKNHRLEEVFERYKHIIVRKSSEEVIFAMNAMVPEGEERNEYTRVLQNVLFNAPPVHTSDVKVPARWMLFHLELSRLSEEGLLEMSTCTAVADRIQLRNDLPNAMDYFTKVALHMRFPEKLPKLVFTKVNPIVSRLSTVLAATFTQPEFDPMEEERENLRVNGIVTKAFVHKLFDGKFEQNPFSVDDFFSLLEYLCIAVKIDDSKDFIPCVLPLEDPNPADFPNKSDPILLTWNGKVLPQGFFPALVVQLLQRKIAPLFSHCAGEKQLRRAVCLDSQYGALRLVYQTSWFELYFAGKLQYSQIMLEAVEESSRALADVLNIHSFGVLKRAFHCTGVCGSKHPVHPALLTDTNEGQCTKRAVYRFALSSNRTCWINPTTGLSFEDVLDKPPEIKDVFDFVKYISALWNEFGRELNVPENYRATLRRNVSLSDEDRLESVLSKWIEKETKAVKWRVVLGALNALEKKDIIKKVITYLEKPETYRKYISMDDFSPCLFRST